VTEHIHVNDRCDRLDVSNEDADLCDKESQDNCSDWLVIGVGRLENAQEWNDVVARYCLQQPRGTCMTVQQYTVLSMLYCCNC